MPRGAMVEMAADEVFTGWASCDDIETRRVEDGLRAAFDIAR